MKSRAVESCVEHLCKKGCRAVWEDIAVLEEGGRLPETSRLSAEETHQCDSALATLSTPNCF